METKSTPVSVGKEENNKERKYPRFVKEDDFCTWCSGIARLIKVQVEEYQNQEVVMMYYECTSKRCDHIFYYSKPNVYRIYDFGKNSVSQFNSYKNKKNPLEITEEDIVGEA